MAAWLSSRGTAHRRILRPVPSGLLPVVNSSPRPGFALQSICYSSHPLCILVDLGPSLGYIGLHYGLSLWISDCHSDCHKSAVSFCNSLKCFPSLEILDRFMIITRGLSAPGLSVLGIGAAKGGKVQGITFTRGDNLAGVWTSSPHDRPSQLSS